MSFTSKSKTKYFWAWHDFYLMMVLSVTLLLPFGKVGLAAENESVLQLLTPADASVAAEKESVQHFKMLSTVEYTGKRKFKSQVESVFTTRKQLLSDDKVEYFISAKDFDLAGEGKKLSFIVDSKTRRLSGLSGDLALLEKVNNQCIKSLQKVLKDNIGKTWKQSFKLSSLGKSFPDELKFTLKAIRVKTKVFGEMIAVRALSKPFVVKAAKKEGGTGPVKCTIGAVYLFNQEIETVYMSISTFTATTKINGFKETLRHEVATYTTDAEGVSVNLSGLGKKFEKLVKQLRLTRKSLKIKKETPLPQWVKSEGLATGQMANVCAAIACEGAINPVILVCVPAAQTFAMQSLGTLASIGGLATAGTLGSVSGSLGAGVPAVGALGIAPGPAFMGMGLGTAGAIAGGTVGTVAVAGGGGAGGGGAGTVTPASP